MIPSGCLPVLCSTFDADGQIDFDDFDRLIDFVIDCGVDGCVFPGVASEVETLIPEERERMIRHLGARLAGRLPIVVGASAATAEETVSHIRIGAEAGATAAMVMAPSVAGREAAGQIAHFRAIERQAALPVMLQNAPAPAGAALAPETVAEVASTVRAIEAVKEETMPCGQNLTRIRTAAGNGIRGVFSGAGGRYITDELARGALGTLPAAELADLHARLYRAWADGDEAEARRLYRVSMPLLNFQAIFRMQMTKEVLRLRGVLHHTFVRSAGSRMDEGDRAELYALLRQAAPEFDRHPVLWQAAAE
ncbi:MAG: dihydrodipicolinate synthase family protein [Pseudomonadota bacterium]